MKAPKVWSELFKYKEMSPLLLETPNKLPNPAKKQLEQQWGKKYLKMLQNLVYTYYLPS